MDRENRRNVLPLGDFSEWLIIRVFNDNQTKAKNIDLQECSCHKQCRSDLYELQTEPLSVFLLFLRLYMKICSVMQSILGMPNKDTNNSFVSISEALIARYTHRIWFVFFYYLYVRRIYSFVFFCSSNFSFNFQLNVTTESTLILLVKNILDNNGQQQHTVHSTTTTRKKNSKSKRFLCFFYILMHKSLIERKRLKNVSPTYIRYVWSLCNSISMTCQVCERTKMSKTKFRQTTRCKAFRDWGIVCKAAKLQWHMTM